jgi:uncharacterized protein YdbL (DUF1318 family)
MKMESMMKSLRLAAFAFGVLFLAACVTINIYFPAAEAQQAAEEIVKDILGKEKVDKPGKDDQSMQLPGHHQFIVINPLEWLIPSAQAATPDFNINTPTVRKLQAAMKQRHGALVAFYKNGAIGFTNKALVGVRQQSAVPLKQRSHLKKLVAAENRERNQLYQEIAKANGHPEWETDVRNIFARTWIKEAAAGWWYQDAGGNWKQK